jgi:phosphohistidine phosphatase
VTVYLMRHGDALRENDGDGRPLSLRGREEAGIAAEALIRLGAGFPVIYHSGKRRALETAEIVASHLDPEPRIEALAGLAPGDDPGIVRDMIETGRRPLLLTGHLPHLARLASLLTTGDADRGIVQLPTAGLIAIARLESRWQLLWVLTPAVLHGLAGVGDR